ncbi:Predicted naringenin-chalcone synthase [Catalinimonas alkaloidigena]|uniref:Predicted naringenin-chalcone synthase n=1 Tax=Catalinimonas alkaloidigena TaxID=1075417 RepID=A0A1G9QL66_9BACT|nr:type III polyketide synthase [Catalinimonas alkaloidigena]SDM11571.1 Predicted naringenin-chalcone synthase [Catalinimonas alkaloidigena]
MSLIVSIGTAVPPYKNQQAAIASFMEDAYQETPGALRKLRFLHEHSGIDTRHSVLADFSQQLGERLFFPVPHMNGSEPKVDRRMEEYERQALPLATEAIHEAVKSLATVGEALKTDEITHLITVSCTGLVAPGLDVALVQQLGLPPDVWRTSVNFLGCNAAFHALKQADLICRTDNQAVVLVICVELCTLHFQPSEQSDHLLANSLFADGAAASVITSTTQARQKGWSGLHIDGFYGTLAHEGKEAMGWFVTPKGFVMTLSNRVPSLLLKHCNDMLERALARFRLQREQIGHWAIHPGGKKILDAVQEAFRLEDRDMQTSREVLQHFGNMSSPTILFVLRHYLEARLEIRRAGQQLAKLFAVGFGPGLSMESAIFSYVYD